MSQHWNPHSLACDDLCVHEVVHRPKSVEPVFRQPRLLQPTDSHGQYVPEPIDRPLPRLDIPAQTIPTPDIPAPTLPTPDHSIQLLPPPVLHVQSFDPENNIRIFSVCQYSSSSVVSYRSTRCNYKSASKFKFAFISLGTWIRDEMCVGSGICAS